MTLLTSYFVSKQKRHENTNDAFLSLTTGKSTNNHPVFDLWIFESGSIIYKGVSNVKKTGVHKTSISLDIISKIKDLAVNLTSNEIGDTKGRDNPLTIIKYNDKKIVYQSARAKGKLLELNNLLKHIANIINEEL